jgi:hypothetical protein
MLPPTVFALIRAFLRKIRFIFGATAPNPAKDLRSRASAKLYGGQKLDGASRGVPAEGVDANPRTARGCGVGGDFPHKNK